MANCISCGRQLPAFSFGERSEVCPECRARAVDMRVQSPGAPATAVATVRRWPPVTTALVGINLAVFAAMALSGISLTDPTSAQLLQWGADWGPLSLGAQPWRILTSNYLHIGLLHIAFNMWCLWDLGSLTERIFDRWTYVLTYTACGVAGSIASLWRNPMVVGAGASGAIFGLAGALMAALYLGHLPFPRQAMRRTLRSLVIFSVYNLGFGAAVRGIDNSAHIGGLVCGLVLGAVLAKHLTSPPEVRVPWSRVVFIAAAAILAVAFTTVRRVNAYAVSLGQGVTALEKGQVDDAVRNLEQASARRPDDPLVLLELGHAYLLKKDYASAANVLQRAVQSDSEDADAQYDLGFALFKLGNSAQAIAPLEKATQLDPKNSAALLVLGEAYAEQNRPADASNAFHRANQLVQGSQQ